MDVLRAWVPVSVTGASAAGGRRGKTAVELPCALAHRLLGGRSSLPASGTDQARVPDWNLTVNGVP